MSEFHKKHIGPQNYHIEEMLSFLEEKSLKDLIKKIVPENILDIDENSIGNEQFSENEILTHVKNIGEKNQLYRSLIAVSYTHLTLPTIYSV